MNEPEQFIVDLIEANKGTILSLPDVAGQIEFRGSALVSAMVGYFVHLEPAQGLQHEVTLPQPILGEGFLSIHADTTSFTADTTELRADLV